jgi:hypothetical protein
MKEETTISKILESMVGMPEVDMANFISVQPVLMIEVGKETRGQYASGEHPEGHPGNVGTVHCNLRHSLEDMAIGRAAKLAPEAAQGFICTTGMDSVPMQEDPVADYAGKLVPEEVWMLLFQVFQGFHVGGHGIMVPEDNAKLALREICQKILDKGHGCCYRTTEYPML